MSRAKKKNNLLEKRLEDGDSHLFIPLETLPPKQLQMIVAYSILLRLLSGAKSVVATATYADGRKILVTFK